MLVHAYELIDDVANKLHKEDDDVFLIAVLEQHSDTMVPPTIYAATFYDQWKNRNVIPDWLSDWCIDVMVGRWFPAAGPIIVNTPTKKRGHK